VVETIQAEGGVHVASAEWLAAVRQLARDVGALFVIDEIQVGCGRTGSYFSFDGLDLDPDVVCLAKGIGGLGTPLAMNLVKPEHDAHWLPGEHTGTFRGQGLSFVAGREALGRFDDDAFLARVRAKGETMASAVAAIVADANDDGGGDRGFAARGRGMIVGLDLGDGALAKAVTRECFEQGLLICPCGTGGRVMKLIPPLTIPDDDLAEGLEILARAVRSVT
jgi:diaminobutyrate-2-oxoglutarate transaminase